MLHVAFGTTFKNSQDHTHPCLLYTSEPGDLPTIPAFGIEWTLPVQYSNLRFFGAGPEETYQDRKHAKLGVWSTDAFKDHAPYLMPQETGNHEDVRWAEITDCLLYTSRCV